MIWDKKYMFSSNKRNQDNCIELLRAVVKNCQVKKCNYQVIKIFNVVKKTTFFLTRYPVNRKINSKNVTPSEEI